MFSTYTNVSLYTLIPLLVFPENALSMTHRGMNCARHWKTHQEENSGDIARSTWNKWKTISTNYMVRNSTQI